MELKGADGTAIVQREFKLEAVLLVRDRSVLVRQAGRDLDIGENILRRWVKETTADPGQGLSGQAQVKPVQLEVDRLRREVVKLKAGRDIYVSLMLSDSNAATA